MPHKFFIAGVQFRPNASNVLKGVVKGDEFDLVQEPDNKFDSNAVRIIFNNEHVGYVPKKLSAEVSALLETADEVVCVATQVNPQGRPWEMCEVEILTREEAEDRADEEFEDFDDDGDPDELKENQDFAQDDNLRDYKQE